jgi:hypothetical protein
MWDFKNTPKKYLVLGVLSVVVLLLLVNALQPSNFLYEDKTDYEALRRQEAIDLAGYQAYLHSIPTDTQASQQLMDQLFSEADIQQQIETKLNTKQAITIPEIPDSEIALTGTQGKEALIGYFNQLSQPLARLEQSFSRADSQLFAEDQPWEEIQGVITESSAVVKGMYAIPVPKEAAVFHKSQLLTFEQAIDLLKTAQQYQTSRGADDPIWPRVYADYRVINNKVVTAKKEFDRLDQQYALNEAFVAQGDTEATAFNGLLFKKAQAQFAVVDIFQKIETIAKQLLLGAFNEFFQSLTEDLISKLESNYKIANFLFYTDALVKSQYVPDYLSKYVADPLDRELIKKFIPQFSCALNKENLRPIFQAKAIQYLGFDPGALNPAEPDFYSKLAKLGEPLASPEGQESNFRSLGAVASVQAYDAAVTEQLHTTGLKVPRSATGRAIAVSSTALQGTLSQLLATKLNLSIIHGDTTIAKIGAEATRTFLSKLAFTGIVYKEQDTCIPTPQLTPVISN